MSLSWLTLNLDEIGVVTPEDEYSYFNLHKPLSGQDKLNSSTDAVVDDLGNDLDGSFGDYMDNKNIIVDNIQDIDNDNQVPPEYANDPEMWYWIQESLKVIHYLLPFQEAQKAQNQDDHEVGLGDDGFADRDNENVEMQDIEMGIEEQKKEKTKTPSTGKVPSFLGSLFIR